MPVWIKNIANFPFLSECNDENIAEFICPRIKLEKMSLGNFEIKFDFSENFDPENPKYENFDLILEKHGIGFIFRPINENVKFPSYQIDIKIDRGNPEHMAFRRLVMGLNQYLEAEASDENSEFYQKVLKGYFEQVKDKIYNDKMKAYLKKKEPRGPEPVRNSEEIIPCRIHNPLYDGAFTSEKGEHVKYSKFSHSAKFAGTGDSTLKSDKAKKAEEKYQKGQLMYISPIKLVNPHNMVFNEKKGIEEPEVKDAEFKVNIDMFKPAKEPRQYDGVATRIQTLKGNAKIAPSGASISINYGPYILQMNICEREAVGRNMDEL